MSNLHPIFENILNQWEKPHEKAGEIGQPCTICGNSTNHQIHANKCIGLGDRLTACKAGSCIVIADMDSERSICLSPMSFDALVNYAKQIGWTPQ